MFVFISSKVSAKRLRRADENNAKNARTVRRRSEVPRRVRSRPAKSEDAEEDKRRENLRKILNDVTRYRIVIIVVVINWRKSFSQKGNFCRQENTISFNLVIFSTEIKFVPRWVRTAFQNNLWWLYYPCDFMQIGM